MEKLRRFTASFLPTLLLLVFLTVNAQAALQAVGPVDPITSIPTWYQDTSSLALVPCLDQTTFCLLPPPFDAATVPRSPITTTGPITDLNFPAEAFYYSSAATMNIEGGAGQPAGDKAVLASVLEYAFLTGVVPNTGIVFLRTDLQKMTKLTPNSTYRCVHPYGTFTFTTDAGGNTTAGGGVAIRQEDPSGTAANYMPPLMQSAAFTNIGPFLKRAVGGLIVDPVSGHTYIGDSVTPVAVTGSPTGNNIFQISRLDAAGNVAATWQTNLFTLMGRVFTGQIPSPMTIDRVTYSRDATSEQVDIFATALPTATLSISGTGLAATSLTRDLAPNTTKYFAHIPLATTTLPTGLNVTNSLDIPPINHPVTLVDDVVITQASYNPVTRAMTIKANSRDDLAPLPTLTVPQFAAPNTLDATGTLVKTLPVNTIPPLTVTVNSSKLGTATAFVSVVTPPAPPVAVDDAATTPAGTAVTISVLTNDTTTDALDPTSVAIVAPSANGTTIVSSNGTITFTPAAGFNGPTTTFTYDVKDTFGQVSNTATVTVTVTAPPPVAPVAVADAATTPAGFIVNIDVLVNDTITLPSVINPASVAIATAPLAAQGTATVNSTTGVITFTPAAGFTGTSTFTYTVKNSSVPALTSNAATVTVTVTAATAPVGGVTLFPNIASPQNLGTKVTFAANGTGGSGSYDYRFFYQNATTGAVFLGRDFSPVSNWVWDTATVAAGNYTIIVHTRNLGSTAVVDAQSQIPYQVTAVATPATQVIVFAAQPSPYPAGSLITFIASGSGSNVPNYEYRFYLQNVSTGIFTQLQGYSPVRSYAWDTTGVTPGNYIIQVDCRSAGSATNFDTQITLPYQVLAPATPATGVTLTSIQPSPQIAGTSVTFAAAGSGSNDGVYEYRYYLQNATTGVFTQVQGYSRTSTWTWNSTGVTPGNYNVQVDVRSAGSTANLDRSFTIPYVITP